MADYVIGDISFDFTKMERYEGRTRFVLEIRGGIIGTVYWECAWYPLRTDVQEAYLRWLDCLIYGE